MTLFRKLLSLNSYAVDKILLKSDLLAIRLSLVFTSFFLGGNLIVARDSPILGAILMIYSILIWFNFIGMITMSARVNLLVKFVGASAWTIFTVLGFNTLFPLGYYIIPAIGFSFSAWCLMLRGY